MKNIKLYFIGAVILFLAGSVITINIQSKKIKRIEADNFRLEGNNYQLMSDTRQQTTLYLTQKEITGKLLQERDSLANRLKIRPKQIEKIIYIDNLTHDTIKVHIPTKIIGKNEWEIRDSTKCLKIVYNAKLKGDSLITKRQLLEYDNKTVQTFYKQRPYKFLFIRFGKWQYKQRIEAQCGETKIETISFIK